MTGDQLRQNNMPSPRVSLIAALAANRVIGQGNSLPWHIPEDLKRFKALTLGHPVIMGRKTFDSILAILGKPLPGRLNIVVTRAAGQSACDGLADLKRVSSLEQAINAAGETDEVFVIGGAEIYTLALPHADRLYLTEILADVDGDAYFPGRDAAQWKEISRQPGTNEGPGGTRYDFVVYARQ